MLNLADLRSSEAKVRNGGSRYNFPACSHRSPGELQWFGEGRTGYGTHVGVFLARGSQTKDSINVERLEIGVSFVRRVSVRTGESEEEMSELFLARFLVVSELRGDGGHVLSRISPHFLFHSPAVDSYKSECALSLCNPTLTLSPSPTRKDHYGYQTFRQ